MKNKSFEAPLIKVKGNYLKYINNKPVQFWKKVSDAVVPHIESGYKENFAIMIFVNDDPSTDNTKLTFKNSNEAIRLITRGISILEDEEAYESCAALKDKLELYKLKLNNNNVKEDIK